MRDALHDLGATSASSMSSILELLPPPPPTLPPAPELLVWYVFLVAASCVNVIYYARTLRRPLSAKRRNYELALRALAGPVVVQCAWRSVFPSLYLQRFTYYDTPLNSILVDRTLACIGELTWNFALALVLTHIDREVIPPHGTWWTKLSAASLFGLYVVAEGTSYYNTATTNELWAAIEVALDATSQLFAVPAAIALLVRVRQRRAHGVLDASRRRGSGSSAHVFLTLFLLSAVVYPAYNFTTDVPMYLRRYRADQAASKQYFAFWDGLRDAATRRVPTRRLEDWRDDMLWMALYFVLNPVAAIAVARAAPSVDAPCCGS